MVITKTPLRISFFGGGTDYPTWVKEHGGAVLSTSIDKYSYINVLRLPPFFPHKTKVVWSRIEEVQDHSEIVHPSVRETLNFLGFTDGISVHYNGDAPARSGIGSSSSFTVGFLHALYALRGERPSRMKLGTEAIHIEQQLIKENVGAQDQMAAAMGGFNKIEFHKDGDITVTPILLPGDRLNELQNHMMLFFTGVSRTASEVVVEQLQNIPKKIEELHAMRRMVDEALEILAGKGDWAGDFGGLLDKSWKLKRSLSSKITNGSIDELYAKAVQAGALGGKLLGAGGGGFFLVFARPEKQAAIKEALHDMLQIPFRFENEGSQLIYQMI